MTGEAFLIARAVVFLVRLGAITVGHLKREVVALRLAIAERVERFLP